MTLHIITYDYTYGMALLLLHDITLHPLHQMCLSRRAFAGHQYLEYEQQRCPRNPGASVYGLVNSGTCFEAAQYRAN
jgi:hypothetical protein